MTLLDFNKIYKYKTDKERFNTSLDIQTKENKWQTLN